MSRLPLPITYLLCALGIGGFILVYALTPKDGIYSTVTAEGVAEWMYQDIHDSEHRLSIEKFGTPQHPKGLEILPLSNRQTTSDGRYYTGLVDGKVFSLSRTKVTGSFYLEATDLTPVDTTTSKDKAEAEARFIGPTGHEYRVVFREFLPADSNLQTYGGVAFNHLVHGETGAGTTALYPEYAYVLIQGFADVYKDGSLVSEKLFTYMAVSQRARISSEEKAADNYNPEEPLGRLLVHVVVLPHNVRGEYTPIPTGVVGEDGKEQDFFHVNYEENIRITGNKFFRTIHKDLPHAH